MFRNFIKNGTRHARQVLTAKKKVAIYSAISSVALIQYQFDRKAVCCEAAFVQSAKPAAAKPTVVFDVTPSKETVSFFQYMKRLVRHIQRILVYIFYGTPLAAIVPVGYLLGDKFPSLEHATWDYLLWTIQRLGPCFVKLAQWMSTRPDMFPPNLIAKLVMLQDDVKVSYKMDTVRQTMLHEFGEEWSKTLSLESTAIGTGSVAQVFRGEVIVDGKPTKVAVKMIHPHVHVQMETDMELLTSLGNFVDMFPSLEILSLGETMRQFAVAMNSQLDLRNEARNLLKFNKKFENDTWAVFPKPIEGFVTKNVLVETLMDGTPIKNYMENQPNLPETLSLKLSDLGTRLVTKMIFFDNFIHGDLHPGNLLVKIKDNKEVILQVLDCGIVYSSKSEDEHDKLVEVCLSFMNHDGRKAARLIVDMNKDRLGHDALPPPEAFLEGMQDLVDRSEHEAFFQHIAEYLDTICELARAHKVRLDPGYFKIAMALKICEGMSLCFEHDLDLVTKIAPVIVKVKAMRKLGLSSFPVDEDIMENKYIRGDRGRYDQKKGEFVKK